MMECMKSNNLNAALNLKGDSYFYTANQLEKVLPSCPVWVVVARTIACVQVLKRMYKFFGYYNPY